MSACACHTSRRQRVCELRPRPQDGETHRWATMHSPFEAAVASLAGRAAPSCLFPGARWMKFCPPPSRTQEVLRWSSRRTLLALPVPGTDKPVPCLSGGRRPPLFRRIVRAPGLGRPPGSYCRLMDHRPSKPLTEKSGLRGAAPTQWSKTV